MAHPSRLEEALGLKAAELDPATERYPDLACLHAYWHAKRGERFAPRRADIDPTDFVEALPRIMLADVLREPLAFRYRLSGTRTLDIHGEDFTGKSPLDFKPLAYGELLHAHYALAVERRAPILHAVMLHTRMYSLSYARLLLPLSEDGETVSMLMIVNSRERNTEGFRKFFESIRSEHPQRLGPSPGSLSPTVEEIS